MIIHTQDLDDMAHRYRVQLINSISGFKSAHLIGTISAAGVTNLAMISSVFHLGADPALIGYVCRPRSAVRDTLDNIEATGFYTINHCHSQIFKPAHQTSARYPSEVSEFTATGLREAFGEVHPAPYVAESKVRIGLKFAEKKFVDRNQTTLVIGEVIEIQFPDEALCHDGHVRLEMLDSICVSGLDRYHRTQELARLSYAKPDRPLHEIVDDR